MTGGGLQDRPAAEVASPAAPWAPTTLARSTAGATSAPLGRQQRGLPMVDAPPNAARVLPELGVPYADWRLRF